MPIPNIYTQTEDPTSQVGNNGDIYFHTGLANSINIYRKANGHWSLVGEVTTNVGGNPGTISDKQVAFGNGSAIEGSDNFKWDGQVLRLQDDAAAHNLFVGFQENAFGPISGTHNTGIGVDVLDTLTTGEGNTAVGFNAGSTFDTASNNVCIGSGAQSENNSSNSTVIGGDALSNAERGTAIGNGARADGIESVAIGYTAHAYLDNTMVLGTFGSITDIYCGFRISNSTSTATVHAFGFIGDGSGLTNLDSSQIVFPDSDPHIAGAGYWFAGVLTRSNG